MLYLIGVNISILGSIFSESDDEAVESSNNNEESPKEKDVARVTENTESYTLKVNKKIVDSAIEKGPELVVVGLKM